MEVEPQDLRLGPLPQAHLSRLLPSDGATVPALALDLLAQVILQLNGEPGLPPESRSATCCR